MRTQPLSSAVFTASLADARTLLRAPFHVYLPIFKLTLPFVYFPPRGVHSTSLYGSLFLPYCVLAMMSPSSPECI